MPNSQQWVLYWCDVEGQTSVYGPYDDHEAASREQLALTRAYGGRYRTNTVLPLCPPFTKKEQ